MDEPICVNTTGSPSVQKKISRFASPFSFVKFAVDANAKDTEIDELKVDLKRFGIPKVDQKKLPIPAPSGPKQPTPPEEKKTDRMSAPPDSAKAVKPVTKPESKPKPAPSR